MTDPRRRTIVLAGVSVVALAIVAGCTSGSDGNGTPSVVATATVTATGSASSAAPPTGSGVPATSTAPVSSGATGSPTSSQNSSGPGLCTPTVMTFRLGVGGGAAGTSYQPIVATNASKQPCVTTGFPGVAMLNAAGRQIAQASRVQGGVSVTTIVVQPGQQVSALLASATMAPGVDSCPTAPAILFTMPDNNDSTRIIAGLPACADGVRVGPLVRGTTGQ